MSKRGADGYTFDERADLRPFNFNRPFSARSPSMPNNLSPWLPAIALALGALIAFGVRHYLDVKEFNSRDRRGR